MKTTKRNLLRVLANDRPNLKRAYDAVRMLEAEHKVPAGLYGSQEILDLYQEYQMLRRAS